MGMILTIFRDTGVCRFWFDSLGISVGLQTVGRTSSEDGAAGCMAWTPSTFTFFNSIVANKTL